MIADRSAFAPTAIVACLLFARPPSRLPHI
jgi:hypothetical protein